MKILSDSVVSKDDLEALAASHRAQALLNARRFKIIQICIGVSFVLNVLIDCGIRYLA